MYQSAPSQARAHVVGDSPLLRAGLKRAASQVGMVVVDEGEDATVTLRHSESQSATTAVAVTVKPGQVKISLATPPTALEWDALRRLVDEVLDPSQNSSPHPHS